MKIGICAPADLHALAQHLGKSAEGLPRGLGSTATTPLVASLVDRGHQITLFTLSHDMDSEQRFDWGPLMIRVGPARRIHFTRDFYKREIEYLRGAIREESPPFVNAHWTYEFALGALLARVPTLVTIHDLPWNVLRHFRDPHRTVRLMMAYSVAARCKRFTAVSQDAARHFRRYLRPDAVIDVIPNFCQDKQLVVPTSGLDSASPLTFATVLQGWTRRKNPKPAVRAFQEIRREFPATRLLMIGEGYGPGGEANLWASSKGLAEGISFVGPLPHSEVLSVLQSEVDVLLHPSLDEAFSLTILEAMSLSKPVIAGAKTPGVLEMLGDEAGLARDVSDPKDIAGAMRTLIQDRSIRMALGKAGKRRTSTVFSAERVVSMYEEVYFRFTSS
jgi:glycosyltransferase involved in cell wall biosynthesis